MDKFWRDILGGESGESGASYHCTARVGIGQYIGYNPAIEKCATNATIATGADLYAQAEREAIQAEADELPDADPSGTAGVPGFEGHLTPTPAPGVRHRPAMAQQSAPARVTCSGCAHFRPGDPNPAESLGFCGLTANGLPPAVVHGDYRAAYPHAPRACRDYMPMEETHEHRHHD